MKSLCFATLLILCSLLSPAQQMQGVIASTSSSEPLPLVSVYCPGTMGSPYVGTVTDGNGHFQLPAKETDLPDSLTVSCIGYKTRRVAVSSLPDTILLEEAVTNLPEVEVSALAAREFIQKCIVSIPANYKNVKFRNHGFNSQLLKKDNEYCELTQSYVTIDHQYSGGKISISTTYDSLARTPSGPSHVIPLYRDLPSHLYFDLIRTGPTVLSEASFQDWQFSYRFEGPSIEDIVVIEAKSPGRFINDYTFFVNALDLAFVKIEYQYQWTEGWTDTNTAFPLRKYVIGGTEDTVRYVIRDIRGTIQYEKTYRKYNLKYLFNTIRYRELVRDIDPSVPLKAFECVLMDELIISISREYLLGTELPEEQSGTWQHMAGPAPQPHKEFSQAAISLRPGQ